MDSSDRWFWVMVAGVVLCMMVLASGNQQHAYESCADDPTQCVSVEK